MDVDVGVVATAVRAARARAARKSDPADERTSVITFRVTSAERTMLQAVAELQDESVSAFVRNSALDIALAIVEKEGPAELDRRYRARQDEQADKKVQAVAAIVAAAGKHS